MPRSPPIFDLSMKLQAMCVSFHASPLTIHSTTHLLISLDTAKPLNGTRKSSCTLDRAKGFKRLACRLSELFPEAPAEWTARHLWSTSYGWGPAAYSPFARNSKCKELQDRLWQQSPVTLTESSDPMYMGAFFPRQAR